MAHDKHKLRDGDCHLCSICNKPARTELDDIIVVHRYNLSIVAKCMGSSVNNCIHAPFVTGCSMRMSRSDGTWCDFHYSDSMQSLPEVNNAMSFLTRNNFIANPPGTVVVWVS